MQLGLGIGSHYFITNSNMILIISHLVLADPPAPVLCVTDCCTRRTYICSSTSNHLHRVGVVLLGRRRALGATLIAASLQVIYCGRPRTSAASRVEFLAALKRKDEAEVKRLKPLLNARLEKWDRALAKEYNDPGVGHTKRV